MLKSSSIDVILGIDWLNPRKAIIQGENGTIHLISKLGEEVICQATTKTKEVCSVNQMEGATMIWRILPRSCSHSINIVVPLNYNIVFML